jgi:hypothetical protein
MTLVIILCGDEHPKTRGSRPPAGGISPFARATQGTAQ